MNESTGPDVYNMLSRDCSPRRFVTIGASSSANKGAASMLQAVIDNLEGVVGPCCIDVLTTYPAEDAANPPRSRATASVQIVSCGPWELLVLMLPLALLISLTRALGGSGRVFCLTPALRSLAEADLVLDLAGISFSDGRGFPILGYNVLMTVVPLLVSARVVKCSQALGPFQEPLNRTLAESVLPRLAMVIARGVETSRHLASLDLENTSSAADLAYVMEVTDEDRIEGERLVRQAVGDHPFVTVIPSTVLELRSRRLGIPYVDAMAQFIRRVTKNGTRVLIVPHAARPGRPPGHMNDLPLVERIHAKVADSRCSMLRESMAPQVLRCVIGRSKVAVTGRFHGLVSALCEATPVLVTGWGHKYEEVLTPFGLEDWCMPYQAVNATTLYERLERLLERKEAIRSSIRTHLPEVVEDAHRNFDIIQQMAQWEVKRP